MDPLDVMMNKDKVIPYYQPIVSADKQLVVGYEVLAYMETSEGNENLGWFFKDKSIPDEFRLELDDHLQRIALDMFIESDQRNVILFNYDADLLLKDNGETLLKRLEPYQERGLQLQQLVLALKEDEVAEHLDEIKHLLIFLQSTGLRIAISDIGQSNTNLDQIAMLKPNIVKVNVEFMEEEELPHLYREVHHSLSMLSRKIGATLLFEGVSNFKQLNYAWRNGGRYYQGTYLMRPVPGFVDPAFCKEKMQKEFHHFIVFERRKMEAQLSLTNKLNQQLKSSMKKMKAEDSYDEIIIKIAEDCTPFAFRIYICNEEGFQQSSNAERTSEKNWTLIEEGRYKNWSWRPYFLENIVRMNVEKKGILSDLYTDIERDERIRTYSYPISDKLFLFLDIPYDFLFEQDGLL